MFEPLPPTAIAKDIAAQMGGVAPLIVGLLAQHGASWSVQQSLGPIVSEWCDRSDYVSVGEQAWNALRAMMLAEWRAATA